MVYKVAHALVSNYVDIIIPTSIATHSFPINHLTTDDDYNHHRNLAACYQSVQSILKIGSGLAERMGRRGGG